MRIGVNSTGIKYYADGRHLADAMKFRTSFGGQDRGWLPTKEWEGDRPPIDVVRDYNGYPIGMGNLDFQTPRRAWRTTPFMHNDYMYDFGEWTLIFEGTGRIAVVSNGQHRWKGDQFTEPGVRHKFVVSPPDNQGIMIFIEESDPEDHIRNIRIYPPGQYEDGVSIVDGGESGRTWHPRYLDRLKPFSHIRAMDFLQTNGSEWDGWETRVLPGQMQTTKKGLALEYLIDLTNESGKDLWYCIPHTATLDDCRKIGQFFKKRLRKDIRLFVETSNELWNGAFSHTLDIRESGHVPGANWQQRFANKYVPMMQAFRDGWGGQDRQLVLVIAWQNANLSWTENVLKEVEKIDPSVIGMIATAPYFGHNFHKSIPIDTSLEEARGMMSEMMPAEMEKVLPRRLAELRRDWSIRLGRRILLGLYEAGQHFHLGRKPAPDPVMLGLQETPEMEAAYLAYLSRIEALGVDEVSLFTLSGVWSQHGAWGLTESLQDDPMDHAKSRAVQRFMNGERLEMIPHPNPVEEYVFLELPELSERMIVDDGDPGYEETGEWQSSTHGGHDGSSRLSQNTSSKARWTFPVVPGRAYQVSANWSRASNRTQNAVYTISSNNTVLTQVSVDQTLSANEFKYAGGEWKSLGTVTPDEDTMVIELTSDQLQSRYMVADGILVEEDDLVNREVVLFDTEMTYQKIDGHLRLIFTPR